MFEIKNGMSKENLEDRGEDHVGSCATTPLRADAFDISDADKIEKIQENVREILLTLGMDLSNYRL